MKKILTLVFAVFAMSQISAYAIEPDGPVGISVLKNGAVVKLFYRAEQAGKVKVTIYNERGRIVFTETMKDREHFMRPYNFSRLPSGDYTIELLDAQGTRVKTIHHAKEERRRTAYLTRLSEDENKYMLSVLNEGSNPLTVRIYDAYSRMVYNNTEVIHGDFAAVYNLNKLSGACLFEVVDQKGNRVRLKK